MTEKQPADSRKQIVPLPSEELEEALALVWEVFSDFESRELPQEALDEFWNRIDYEYMLHRMGDGELRFWGAYDAGELVGVCAVRDLRRIELLYVDGDYHRQGVATNLLKHALIDCRTLDDTVTRVTVNATPYSRGFFLKQGFRTVAPEHTEDGLTLIPMALEAN
ncbi:MAG: GNAT family N-acetyltransferase [Clostridia bacterium]|nr:GNAT family N-acetyltransferase [Clostridia bacterium]